MKLWDEWSKAIEVKMFCIVQTFRPIMGSMGDTMTMSMKLWDVEWSKAIDEVGPHERDHVWRSSATRPMSYSRRHAAWPMSKTLSPRSMIWLPMKRAPKRCATGARSPPNKL